MSRFVPQLLSLALGGYFDFGEGRGEQLADLWVQRLCVQAIGRFRRSQLVHPWLTGRPGPPSKADNAQQGPKDACYAKSFSILIWLDVRRTSQIPNRS
jgi:hypothetical protein